MWYGFLFELTKVPSKFEQNPLLCIRAQSCPTLCHPMDWLLPDRLLCPWDFPGKNTGVGCHFLLQNKILIFISYLLFLKASLCTTNLGNLFTGGISSISGSLESSTPALSLGFLQAQPGILASVSGLRALSLWTQRRPPALAAGFPALWQCP